MRRALCLAASSPFYTHPNPMVGAVITARGRIIGEGYHRRCGQGHAEVNAIASVADADRSLLQEATMYVTLEPCSHYGKTPPCAKLLIDNRVRRVVVGAVDPFEKVAGRGIEMLRQAGIKVEVGVLADESRALNHKFFTAHTLRRPFVTLKWAQSCDGFMDARREPDQPAHRFSTEFTGVLTQLERARHDAILTTAATVIADNPRMNVRGIDGPSPLRVVIDRHGLLSNNYRIFDSSAPTLVYKPEAGECRREISIAEILNDLYAKGITSVLVEAGPRMLQAFIDAGLWDAIRVEAAPVSLGKEGTSPVPTFAGQLISRDKYDDNEISIYHPQNQPHDNHDQTLLTNRL